jgi:hypothetical protein
MYKIIFCFVLYECDSTGRKHIEGVFQLENPKGRDNWQDLSVDRQMDEKYIMKTGGEGVSEFHLLRTASSVSFS